MHQRLATPSVPPVLERVAGQGRIAVEARDGITHLTELYQDGAAKIRLPSRAEKTGLEAVLINTAGGVTGGDRLAWSATLGPGASLTLTTPAAEKIYRAAAGEARIDVTLSAGPGAKLFWLPQETILFDRTALSRSLTIELAAEDSEALIVEPVIFGREAMGESLSIASFHDRWRIFRDAKLFHAEDFRLGPDAAHMLARPALLAGSRAIASILFVAPHAGDRLDAVRAILGETGGASAWNGRILARIMARSGFDLRQQLLPVLELLNGKAALPKLWSL